MCINNNSNFGAVIIGGRGETRTLTILRSLAPEASASTNFATRPSGLCVDDALRKSDCQFVLFQSPACVAVPVDEARETVRRCRDSEVCVFHGDV